MNNAERELLIAVAKALQNLPWIPADVQDQLERAVEQLEDCMK